MNYAYLRVSTVDKQEFTRQEYILKDYKIDKMFQEKISGTKKASHRPEFEKLLSEIQEGDTIYFESMSRMARSMQDLIDTTNMLANKRKVKVIFVKENISVGGDGMDAMTGLVFNIMGAFAQFERDLISDRTKTALRAKMQDTNFKIGREPIYLADTQDRVCELYGQGNTMQEVADALGMSRATVSRIIAKRRKE